MDLSKKNKQLKENNPQEEIPPSPSLSSFGYYQYYPNLNPYLYPLYGNELQSAGDLITLQLSYMFANWLQTYQAVQYLAACREIIEKQQQEQIGKKGPDNSVGNSPSSSRCSSRNELPITVTSNSNVNNYSNNNNQAKADKNYQKQYECDICKRSFRYKHVLQNHHRTHTGEKPFECTTCYKRFTRDHHLKTHIRLHTGERPYHCQHCDKEFVQVANLRRHSRIHNK